MSTVENVLPRNLDSQRATDFQEKPTLLYDVLEVMLDGILVVTSLGQIRYANPSAQAICQQLTSRSTLPPQIWKSCRALLETQSRFADRLLALEDEIHIDQQNLRIRICSIEWAMNQTCLLVTIENRDCHNQSAALLEAQRYGLTRRETEVWLLKRANLSHKAIAAKLHIAIDTVKKHLKNIRAKQQIVMWREQK